MKVEVFNMPTLRASIATNAMSLLAYTIPKGLLDRLTYAVCTFNVSCIGALDWHSGLDRAATVVQAAATRQDLRKRAILPLRSVMI